MKWFYLNVALTYITIGFAAAILIYYVLKRPILGRFWGALIIGLIGSFLGGVIYREFTWQSLLESLRNSAVTTASITFTIAGASVIAWVATAEQIGPKLAQAFLAVTDNPLLIIFMINALLLLLGFPLEPIPMIMMLIPILMPVVKQLHIDPVHFIVIFTINIQLALLTPPVGANLFVVTAISKSTILAVSRELIPFLIALLVALVILILYPPLTLWLPKMLMG